MCNKVIRKCILSPDDLCRNEAEETLTIYILYKLKMKTVLEPPYEYSFYRNIYFLFNI